MKNIEQCKPDFIIIGAMKAATSAIYEYLMQHPQIIHRLPKELHFFTLNYDKGLDWYLSQFDVQEKKSDRTKLIGEASPSYLTSKEAAKLIYQFFPTIKIIVSLRNSTDRAISHYYHQLNRVKDEVRPIEIAFSTKEIDQGHKTPDSKTNSYLQLSKYAPQIQHWLRIFPPEQLLILNYHQLELEPRLFLKKIFNFLDLEDYKINNLKKIYSNQYPIIPSEIRARLDRYFLASDRELKDLIDIQLGRN